VCVGINVLRSASDISRTLAHLTKRKVALPCVDVPVWHAFDRCLACSVTCDSRVNQHEWEHLQSAILRQLENRQMAPQISVAIVNFNTKDELRTCIRSVADQASEVLIFDNASPDGSSEMVRREFPWATVITAEANIGFGAAANQIVSRCRSDIILLLNSDTVVEPGATERLTRFLHEHPRAALVGPRLANRDGTLQPSCYPYPGSLRWVLDNDVVCGFLRLLPSLGERSYRGWAHTSDRVVPWVKGAALVIRKEAFDQVGGFDESFFMYHEETDLCYRLTSAGWEIRFAAVATILHVGSVSTDQCRSEMLVRLFTSTLHFHRQHYTGLRCLVLQWLWQVIIVCRYVRDQFRVRTARGTARIRIQQDLAAWKQILTSRTENAGCCTADEQAL
jgi:GT2 family glycosyltransferase